jgi:phosphoribosyl-AMP cyclohydrolase
MEIDLNYEKNDGFVIAIVQDVNTKDVLMVAHANREAVETSKKTGLATFWSKSRNELWTKGLTSGDTLKIVEIRADCDRDAILYLVEPQGDGGACHKAGWFSCFGYML